ncbi:hypothetical protein TIFTF001_050196 [Ficus carica]|uniref:Uncharacterized protein n=1 Tax=Ficus carica TaxID=3494 RepID=A0AA88CYY3_FICCA|nr:hypothetical protein TIFTF001_050196 [Ficus carica]
MLRLEMQGSEEANSDQIPRLLLQAHPSTNPESQPSASPDPGQPNEPPTPLREPPTSRARRRRGWRLETSGRATREIGLVATLPSGRFADRPSPAMASVEPPARRSSRIYFGARSWPLLMPSPP